MIIHVRNFGKIESADIDLSDLVIFVGENNSGKTYLMQLIYGLFSFFFGIDSNEINKVISELKAENEQIKIKKYDSQFYDTFQTALNSYIKHNKDAIIESVFHTNSLTIDSLSVEFSALPDDFSMFYDGEVERDKGIFKSYSLYKNKKLLYKVRFGKFFPQKFIDNIIAQELAKILLSELTGLSVDHGEDEKSFIYLPASRSGIMLLYANYLSDNKKSDGLKKDGVIIEEDAKNNAENKYGLTEPVYDFLMFLLKYKNSERAIDNNKSLISFIDQNIINGHLSKVGNAMRYQPDNSDTSIPISLSSSLISELSPIYQVISGIHRFTYIMYDEIETCQHPTKQLQLARLLVRMINTGFKMIVSTHSDTMAAAINNLITLSFNENKSKLISELGYEEADIIKSSKIKAYQFKIGDNGKTEVAEVESHFSVGIGFDFDLFNTTNNKIYQDAKALAGVE